MSYKLRLAAALLIGLVAVGGFGGIGLMSMASAQPASVKINEVELNPRGRDAGGEWVEIYNPAGADVNIGDYTIKTSWHSNSVTIPAGTVIGAGQLYVLVIDGEKLSNANLLTLVDSAGQQVDRTPALVDRSDSSLTWQRIPDGGSSWRLTEGTNAAANDPRTFKPATSGDGQRGDAQSAGTGDMCAGSAQCMQGKVVRVADADTVYVRAGTDTFKVDLSLSKAGRNAAADAFTRAMCLGNDVKVDQDDKQPGKGKNITGVVYCASTSLNQQLLDNSFASIDKRQCATSEFASQDWAKRHGC
jgi:hypothetical protein